MDKQIIPVILSDHEWFYNLSTGYLHIDASGRTGTFSTETLTVREKEELEAQVDAFHAKNNLEIKLK